MYFVAGLGLGLALGTVVMYVLAVRPLVNAFTRMRYDGFKPDVLPPRPKLVPSLKLPRED